MLANAAKWALRAHKEVKMRSKGSDAGESGIGMRMLMRSGGIDKPLTGPESDPALVGLQFALPGELAHDVRRWASMRLFQTAVQAEGQSKDILKILTVLLRACDPATLGSTQL